MIDRVSLVLGGCTTEPLLNYLKAIGVFRLVSQQCDASAKGYWRDGTFYLDSSLDRAGLVGFFLDEYHPSVILAPWNGGSGFWNKGDAAGRALQAVRESTHPRFSSYRQAITVIDQLIGDTGLQEKPDPDQKLDLLRRVRSRVPDELLPWIDATWALTGDRSQFAPLLGTGGNDGRLEFTANFMQRLAEVLPFSEDCNNGEESNTRNASAKRRKTVRGGTPSPHAKGWLEAALFGDPGHSLLPVAVGQFHPGGSGGPNATQGFEGSSLTNPWDYILMLEGSLLFAGAISRRSGSHTQAGVAFPFTVDFSPAGAGTVIAKERVPARGEIWLPLWDKPSSCREVAQLFAEGRAQIGRRPATTGVEFARAIASLGVARGLSGFHRYAFVQRNGLAYIAAPLGHFAVGHKPNDRLIDEADAWLESFRRYAVGPNAPARAEQDLRRIHEAILAHSRLGGAHRLLDVLCAMGTASYRLAEGKSGREEVNRPLYGLSEAWVTACDDGSTEFRIAAAVASIRDAGVGPIQCQLQPVTIGRMGRFVWSESDTGVTWKSNELVRNMQSTLIRRFLIAERSGTHGHPLRSTVRVSLADVHRFLVGDVNDIRLQELVIAFSAVKSFPSDWPPRSKGGRENLISRSYAMLKLLFDPRSPSERVPDAEQQRQGTQEPPTIARSFGTERPILAQLRAGNIEGAVNLAARQLRILGLNPLGTDNRRGHLMINTVDSAVVAKRVAAALLIPIDDLVSLRRLVLRPRDKPTDTGEEISAAFEH